MQPTIRLARVQQQVHAFADLHASELDAVAAEIEAAGFPALAARLKAFRDLHAQEAALVLEELEDLRAELEGAGGSTTIEPLVAHPTGVAPGDTPVDPAAASPKRARWLAEERRRLEPAPISRREFLTRVKDPS